MNSSFSTKESPTAQEFKPVSLWQTPRFRILAGIAVATALLLSIIAIVSLNSGVGNVTEKKIPYIEKRIDKLPVR